MKKLYILNIWTLWKRWSYEFMHTCSPSACPVVPESVCFLLNFTQWLKSTKQKKRDESGFSRKILFCSKMSKNAPSLPQNIFFLTFIYFKNKLPNCITEMVFINEISEILYFRNTDIRNTWEWKTDQFFRKQKRFFLTWINNKHFNKQINTLINKHFKLQAKLLSRAVR